MGGKADSLSEVQYQGEVALARCYTSLDRRILQIAALCVPNREQTQIPAALHPVLPVQSVRAHCPAPLRQSLGGQR
jgi:hypothetical protein